MLLKEREIFKIIYNERMKAFFAMSGFIVKPVRDMIRTYSQMHLTDMKWQHSSIIWQDWLNGWVFVYKLSGCGFESYCSNLKQVHDLTKTSVKDIKKQKNYLKKIIMVN